jgi:hypothetical protein
MLPTVWRSEGTAKAVDLVQETDFWIVKNNFAWNISHRLSIVGWCEELPTGVLILIIQVTCFWVV